MAQNRSLVYETSVPYTAAPLPLPLDCERAHNAGLRARSGRSAVVAAGTVRTPALPRPKRALGPRRPGCLTGPHAWR